MGIQTIEEELEKAIYRAGLITQDNQDSFSKQGWSRAARTDKGVHAVSNIFNLKLEIPKTMFPQSDTPINKEQFKQGTQLQSIRSRLNNELPSDIRLLAAKYVSRSFRAQCSASSRVYRYILPTKLLNRDLTNPNQEKLEAAILKIKSVANFYQGTHSYHNFSKGYKFGEDSAKRHIINVDISQLNSENLLFSIEGQSFIYHQIRKMIGLLVQMRHLGSDEEILGKAFGPNPFQIWIAPAEGLYLKEVKFKYYNDRINLKEKFVLTDQESLEIANFENQVIVPTILRAESESRM